jgi:hypothetical protein
MSFSWPWWLLVVPWIGPAMRILFVLVAGTIQGRTTGRWPTLTEWTSAVSTNPVNVTRRSSRRSSQPVDPPPDQGDGSTTV